VRALTIWNAHTQSLSSWTRVMSAYHDPLHPACGCSQCQECCDTAEVHCAVCCPEQIEPGDDGRFGTCYVCDRDIDADHEPDYSADDLDGERRCA